MIETICVPISLLKGFYITTIVVGAFASLRLVKGFQDGNTKDIAYFGILLILIYIVVKNHK